MYTIVRREVFTDSDPVLGQLFSKFAAMEAGYMRALSRRYHAEVPAHTDGFRVERAAVYAGIDHSPEDPTNLFRIAIGFEERAARFFAARVQQCPEGSVERQLYEELAAEERGHVDELRTELARWRAGKPGIL